MSNFGFSVKAVRKESRHSTGEPYKNDSIKGITFDAVVFILESFVLSDSVCCSYQSFISKDRVACKPQENESYEWETGCKLYVEVEASHQYLAEHTINYIPTNNH